MKNLFHKGLYAEGLRRGRVLGIMFTCLFAVYAIFYPLNCISRVIYYRSLSEDYVVYNHSLSSMEFNPLYLLVFCMYVPFLALTVFSFLNKRNTSDFYHSLPHKRETIFISYGLSILTWVLFSVVTTALIELVICFFGASYITLNLGSIGIYLLMIVVAAIQVLGALMIAMAITGTTFTNIVTALLILFLPRLLIIAFTETLASMAVVVDAKYFPFFFNLDANLLFSFAKMFMVSMDVTELFAILPTLLYSLALGIIYLFIGGVLFVRRKSESAGNAALNNVIQTAIRVSISFLVCLIPCLLILQNQGEAVWIVALYCIALLVYFVYEVISTRKFSNLKRAVPGLVILLAMNLVFIGGVQISKSVILTQNWTADKISGVVLLGYSDYHSNPSYESLRLEEVTLKNEEVNQMLAEHLTENQKKVKRGEQILYRMEYDDMMVAVKKTDGSTVYRRLSMPKKEMYAFQKLAFETEEMQQTAVLMPENPQFISVNVSGRFTAAQNREIYDSLYQEVQALDIEDQLNLNGYNVLTRSTSGLEYSNQYRYEYQFTLYVEGVYKFREYQSHYTVSQLTPKTYALILKYANAECDKAFADLQQRMKSGDFDKDINFRMNLQTFNLQDDTHSNKSYQSVDLSSEHYTKKNAEIFLDMLENTLRKTPEGDYDYLPLESVLKISFSVGDEDDAYEVYTVMLPVTQEIKTYMAAFELE